MPKNYDFSDFDKPDKAKGSAYDFSDFDSSAAAPKSASDYKPDAEAALQGFGEAASFGYLPQLQAVASKLTPNPSAGVDEALKAKGFKLPEEETYVQARDAAIQREGSLKEHSPGSFVGGELLGALSGGAGVARGLGAAGKAISGGKALVAPGLLTRGAQAAGAGAVQGLVQNPGDIQGKIDLAQGKERSANAGAGAALGAATFGLAGALKGGTDIILGLPKIAKEYAQLKAFKSAGAMLKDFRSASKKVAVVGEDGKDVLIPRIQKIGQEMINKGLVEPGATFKTIGDKAQDLEDSAWKVIDGIYKETQKEVSNPLFLKSLSGDKALALHKTDLNAETFAKDFEKTMKASLKGLPGATRAMSAVDPILNELRDNGAEMGLAQLQKFKVGVQNMVDYDKSIADQPLVKQELIKLRSFLSKKIQDRVGALDAALGGNRLNSLKEANDQFGTWSTVSRIAKDRTQREQANQFMGLTDTIAGAAGIAGGGAAGYHQGGFEGAVKGAALGAGLGLGNKLAKRYGNPLLIKGANFAGGAAGSVPVAPLKAINAPAGLLSQNPMIAGAAGAGLIRKKNESKR